MIHAAALVKKEIYRFRRKIKYILDFCAVQNTHRFSKLIINGTCGKVIAALGDEILSLVGPKVQKMAQFQMAHSKKSPSSYVMKDSHTNI